LTAVKDPPGWKDAESYVGKNAESERQLLWNWQTPSGGNAGYPIQMAGTGIPAFLPAGYGTEIVEGRRSGFNGKHYLRKRRCMLISLL
jgi:acyl CoA:acetate/3-ketoacid CoA transferase alpha subunit